MNNTQTTAPPAGPVYPAQIRPAVPTVVRVATILTGIAGAFLSIPALLMLVQGIQISVQYAGGTYAGVGPPILFAGALLSGVVALLITGVLAVRKGKPSGRIILSALAALTLIPVAPLFVELWTLGAFYSAAWLFLLLPALLATGAILLFTPPAREHFRTTATARTQR